MRIDQFTSSYLNKSTLPLLSTDFDLKPKPQHVSLIDNQLDDREIGRSLLYGLDRDNLGHPLDAINSKKVDLLLIDSFPELQFRISRHKETSKLIYFHPDHLTQPAEGFETIPGWISPSEAIKEFSCLIDSMRKENPRLVSIFINFPANGRGRDDVTARAESIQEASNKLKQQNRCGVIDLIDIRKDEFEPKNDPYHFNRSRYDQYAFMVHGLNHYIASSNRDTEG